MNFGDIKPALRELARYLRQIERHTQCAACASSGGGENVVVTNPESISDPIIAELSNIVDTILTGENTTPHTTSAGVDTSIPANFKSVSITKTNGTGTVTITLSDSTTFDLTAQNEMFADAASQYYLLPGYTIASADGGTWKWHGIQ